MEKKTINLDREIPIVNPKQAAFYWYRGVKPIDIYPDIDSRTQLPILVFIFKRDETYVLYKEWQEQR